jgi:hypothetical protein
MEFFLYSTVTNLLALLRMTEWTQESSSRNSSHVLLITFESLRLVK